MTRSLKTLRLTERWPAVLTKKTGNFVGDALGASEDQDLVLGILVLHDLLQVLDHLVALLALGDNLDNLGDAVVGSQIHGADVDLDEVGLEVGSQGADLLGPGGGPHAGLAVGPDLADDLADLGLETHVEHAVGLVKDEVGDAAKVGLARLEHVNQTTGGGNAHLDAALEVTDLRALGDTTVDASVADPRRLAKLGDLLLNLNRQLTSGSKNQDDRAVAGGEKRLSVDVDDGGEAVGQSLSGTGLGNTDDVASRKRHRPALRLNGGRRRETLGLDFIHDIAGETSLVEGLDGLGDIVSSDGDGVIATELLNLGGGTGADVGMLLVERLLKLGKCVQVPVLLLQASAKVGHAITTAAIAAATAISSTTVAAATAGIAIGPTVAKMNVSNWASKERKDEIAAENEGWTDEQVETYPWE